MAGGIASAAGPAAERKYYLQRKVPIRTLGATEGDHENIEKTAKGLELAGRNRYAYQRLVWRQAQVALEHEKIWLAVNDLAFALNDNYWPMGKTLGEEIETMHGNMARAIMKRSGVFPGILGFVA